MKLSDQIRIIRRERGLTQEQLAEAMGVSTASVSKWETGQSAPELTVLMDLADYFQVSVDALLGHEIKRDHMEALIRDMERCIDAEEFGQAKELAEKLLRGYPNSYRAVEQASNMYHTAYLFTQERACMDRAIDLTERLFALMDDPQGVKRYELLSRLANHYEMVGDWDMAMQYYREGNVARSNDRALARCLANAEKNEEAVKEISEVFQRSLLDLLTDCILLEQVWTKLGQSEKADATLRWGCAAVENAGCGVAEQLRLLRMTMYTELAKSEEQQGKTEHADAHIRMAARICAGIKQGEDREDFLELPEANVCAARSNEGAALLLSWLTAPGQARLLDAVKHELDQ